MAGDRSFVERNRAATARIRELVARLSDAQMQQKVGEHWTVGIALAHLAFWDRRVMYVLDRTEQDGRLFIPNVDIVVNDLSLPLWAAIPPHDAAWLAVESAEALDQRLEEYPDALLAELQAYNERWVVRALHRNAHLDEVDAALNGAAATSSAA
jgi:uncharacterized damage-inducible protein DinB